MTTVGDELKQAQDQLSENPFIPEHYDALIDLLRLGDHNGTQILALREQKNALFKLNQRDIAGYQEDIGSMREQPQSEDIGSMREDQSALLRFHALLKDEYPTAENWATYLDLLPSNTVSLSDYDRALEDCELDYQSSHLVWSRLLKVACSLLEKGQSQFESVFQLYQRRLSRPQKHLDDVFSELSQLVSKHAPEKYEEYMVRANKTYNRTSKSLRYYEEFELPLSQQPADVELWTQYIERIHQFSSPSDRVRHLRVLFYRSLTSGGVLKTGTDEWIPVWLTLLYCLYDSGTLDIARALSHQFVRSYPLSSVSFAEYIRSLDETPPHVQDFLAIRKRIQQCRLMELNNYDTWKTLATTTLSYEFRCVNNSEMLEMVDVLYADIDLFTAHALDNNDIFHTLEKLAINIYEKMDDLDSAETFFKSFVQRFSSQCEVWLMYYEFKKRTNATKDEILHLFASASENVLELDWPERIISEWLSFVQLNGSAKDNRDLVVKADELLKVITLHSITSSDTPNENLVTRKRSDSDESDDKESLKKQKLMPTADESNKRNRELFTIKVKSLPAGVSETSIQNFFKSCGEPNSVLIFKEDDGSISSTVEFHTEQEVLAAMTLGFKKFDGEHDITITRFFEATIWVTNFPPSMSQESLKEMFGKSGKVISTRFPTQKAKRDRRFCYIEYSDAKFAAAAKKMFDNKEVPDDISGRSYKLRVEISDPSRRKERSTFANANEAFVQSLDFKSVTSDDLRRFFEGCGDITSIRAPLNEKSAERGYHNSGFAFVDFKSEVGLENALKLDGHTLANRKIKVSRSKSKQEQQHHSKQVDWADYSDSKTISIFNLNDTLTVQQVQSHLTSEVGEVKKIELLPHINAAIVEFATEAEAGKADMKLSSQDFAGTVIRIGSKRDLLHETQGEKPGKHLEKRPEKQSAKQPLLAPPSMMRRRKR